VIKVLVAQATHGTCVTPKSLVSEHSVQLTTHDRRTTRKGGSGL